MVFKTEYSSQEDIPESITIDDFRSLFTEKNGKWELTGIAGIKTPSDVARATSARDNERKLKDEAIAELNRFKELGDLDDVQAKLDKLPELEAAAGDKLDEAKIDEIANQRADRVVATRIRPLERQIRDLTQERDGLKTSNDDWTEKDRTRRVREDIRKAGTELKMRPEAIQDAEEIGARLFEIREDDGAIVTRDNVGVTPGSVAKDWLTEQQPNRPHWWPDTKGSGSRGSGQGGPGGKDNPFAAETWNVTEQGRIHRELGPEAAQRLAKQAGTTVGGPRPPARTGSGA